MMCCRVLVSIRIMLNKKMIDDCVDISFEYLCCALLLLYMVQVPVPIQNITSRKGHDIDDNDNNRNILKS